MSPEIQRDVEEQEQEVGQGEGGQEQRGVVARVTLPSRMKSIFYSTFCHVKNKEVGGYWNIHHEVRKIRKSKKQPFDVLYNYLLMMARDTAIAELPTTPI